MRIMFLAMVAGSAVLAANPLQPKVTGYYMPEVGFDNFLVSFWNIERFDPLLGLPALPEELTIEEYPGDGTGYYLVQFAGPVYSHQIEEAKQTGADFIGFHSRYLTFAKMNAIVVDSVRKLPFVRWVGVYQPGYKFDTRTLEEEEYGRVSVTIFYAEDIEQAEKDLTDLGCKVIRRGVSEVMKVVEVDCGREMLSNIAKLPYVMSIEEWHPPEPENENCQWVIQTWAQNHRRVWDMGLLGEDEILGYTDLPIDVNHYAFKDPSVPLTERARGLRTYRRFLNPGERLHCASEHDYEQPAQPGASPPHNLKFLVDGCDGTVYQCSSDIRYVCLEE